MSIEKIMGSLKAFGKKFGIDFVVMSIAEAVRESIKDGAKDATKIAQARWLGIGLADEAIFNVALQVLGTTGSMKIAEFLKYLGPKEANLFRLVITTIPDTSEREATLRNFCNLKTDKERKKLFEETIVHPERIEAVAKWIGKNFLKLAEKSPEFGEWCVGCLKKTGTHLASAAESFDKQCGRWARQLKRYNDKQDQARSSAPPFRLRWWFVRMMLGQRIEEKLRS